MNAGRSPSAATRPGTNTVHSSVDREAAPTLRSLYADDLNHNRNATPEIYHMPSKSIEQIEGIGPAYGEKLRNAGCGSPAQLLKDGADRKGRQRIAEQTGISDATILRCVNMADLFRVKGVATQYAELLEASGVDTVKELRTRNAENLAEKMKQINERKRLTRTVPSARVVAGWIEQAKSLPPVVTY